MDERTKEETTNDLIKKIIELDNWIAEKQRKAKPAIIIDSKGHYVSAYGTASFLDYIKAVEEGQVKIKDKEYRKSILKLIENNK